MSDALVVKDLKKGFPVGLMQKLKPILKEISFSVPDKSITGFVGVNGSGKTTSIKCLLRFIFPDKNSKSRIEFFGNTDFTMEVKRRIGYLPERPYLPEQLTAREFLQFHWNLGGGVRDKNVFNQKCQEVLKRVNLIGVETTMLRGFSKGMLQRIALAQAILHKADFLILDEPMSGLDPDGRRIVKDIIRQEHQRGATIFFSSHLLADMDELCSHLVVIDKGEVYFSGAVEGFTHDESGRSQIIYKDQKGQQQQVTAGRNELQAKIAEILSTQGQIVKVGPVETNIESVFTQRKWKDTNKNPGTVR